MLRFGDDLRFDFEGKAIMPQRRFDGPQFGLELITLISISLLHDVPAQKLAPLFEIFDVLCHSSIHC